MSAVNWFHVEHHADQESHTPKQLDIYHESFQSFTPEEQTDFIKLIQTCLERQDKTVFDSQWRKDSKESKLDKLVSSLNSYCPKEDGEKNHIIAEELASSTVLNTITNLLK